MSEGDQVTRDIMTTNRVDIDVQREAYDEYGSWKSWEAGSFMRPSQRETAYFAAEFAVMNVAGENILEIGFGNGGFLGWAASKGAKLWGTEVFLPAIEQARTKGVTILPLDLAESVDQYRGHFAGIVALDVMEHLTFAENKLLLDHVATMLKPGGHFIARFPNGQSPFGRSYQHGDQTHVTTLSASIIRQMVVGLPFTVIRAGNPAIASFGGIAGKLKRKFRQAGQTLLERTISSLYSFSAELGPNTVICLRRD